MQNAHNGRLLTSVSLLLKRHWAFVILLAIFIPLLFADIASVPTPWFDEGMNLSAARTLAQTGFYALPSADGLRPSDPAIQTGPPIIILLSWLYHLTGPDIQAARAVIAVSGLLLLIALYSLVNRLYGPHTALLSIIILWVFPNQDYTETYIMMSRQVLGEIPAALLIVLGLHILLRKKARLGDSIVIGMLFGLAVAIKSQVLLNLSVTVGLFLLYSFFARQDRQRWTIILVAMAATYMLNFLWMRQMANPAQSAYNFETLVQGALIHIVPFNALSNLRSLGTLLRLGLTFIGVIGALKLTASDADSRRIERFMLVLVIVWMLWYSLVSIGWTRYAFIGQIFVAVLLARIAAWCWNRFSIPVNVWSKLALLALGVIVSIGFYREPLASPSKNDHYALISYLDTEVPRDAKILTWEWATVYLSDHQYLLPPTRVTNDITANVVLGRPYDFQSYDPLAGCPDYLLLGSFAADRIVMSHAMQIADPQPLFKQGPYEMYKLPPTEGCPDSPTS